MNYTIVFYLDEGINDNDLLFHDQFIPDTLLGQFKKHESCQKILFSCPSSYKGKLIQEQNCILREHQDDIQFWKGLFEKSGAEHIIKIFVDSPFFDDSIFSEMIDLHEKYLSEFTYSENLPQGLTCEILSKTLIDSIPDVQEKTLPLSKVIKSNINQFDIEIYYKDPDLRDKRISFRSGNPRDKKIMERISESHGRAPRYDELKNVIETKPEMLFMGPSYLEIELSGRCDLDCVFCYRNNLSPFHEHMDGTVFDKILRDMKSFGLPFTICFGGSGEPMMNPQFYSILEAAVHEALVSSIIVETNGIYADQNYKKFLGNAGNKIKTIVNINGYDEETYRTIHSKDFFNKVYQNITALSELNAYGENLYVQVMKINETEPFLDKYYDFWEKKKVQIVLQKQNTYIGRIQDRRYSDLSPLDRIPCWHLQRDMYILFDGRVSFCKQVFDGSISRGNVKDTAINPIFGSMKSDFINDYQKKYCSSPDCKSCDEWYTFNF